MIYLPCLFCGVRPTIQETSIGFCASCPECTSTFSNKTEQWLAVHWNSQHDNRLRCALTQFLSDLSEKSKADKEYPKEATVNDRFYHVLRAEVHEHILQYGVTTKDTCVSTYEHPACNGRDCLVINCVVVKSVPHQDQDVCISFSSH